MFIVCYFCSCFLSIFSFMIARIPPPPLHYLLQGQHLRGTMQAGHTQISNCCLSPSVQRATWTRWNELKSQLHDRTTRPFTFFAPVLFTTSSTPPYTNPLTFAPYAGGRARQSAQSWKRFVHAGATAECQNSDVFTRCKSCAILSFRSTASTGAALITPSLL